MTAEVSMEKVKGCIEELNRKTEARLKSRNKFGTILNEVNLKLYSNGMKPNLYTFWPYTSK